MIKKGKQTHLIQAILRVRIIEKSQYSIEKVQEQHFSQFNSFKKDD